MNGGDSTYQGSALLEIRELSQKISIGIHISSHTRFHLAVILYTNSTACGSRSFNAAFTRAIQYSISWTESTKFLLSLRSILISSSHLNQGLLLSRYLLPFWLHAAHFNLLDLITLTTLGERYKLLSSSHFHPSWVQILTSGPWFQISLAIVSLLTCWPSHECLAVVGDVADAIAALLPTLTVTKNPVFKIVFSSHDVYIQSSCVGDLFIFFDVKTLLKR